MTSTTLYTFLTPCSFIGQSATSNGKGAFMIMSARDGYDLPENLQAIDEKYYRYFAQEETDPTKWEQGSGPWKQGINQLWRFAEQSSEDDNGRVPFSGTIIVWMFPTPPIKLEPGTNHDAGTLMLFQQATAPEGWTKQTTHNDKALRVVSGTPASGGSVDFSTVFARTNTDSHTLTIDEIPSHHHSEGLDDGTSGGGGGGGGGVPTGTRNTGDTGGGQGHSHPIDLRVKYVDVIIASKD